MKKNRILKKLSPLLIISITFAIGCSQQSCISNSKVETVEQPNSEKEILSLITHVETEAWSKGNTEILDELYDPNCILHIGSSMEFKGTQSLKQMIRMFHSIIPDRSFKIDELIIENEKVAEMYTWQGTHKTSGKKLKISGCIIYHFKDGKVIEVWNFEDMLGLYQQLGYANKSPFGPNE